MASLPEPVKTSDSTAYVTPLPKHNIVEEHGSSRAEVLFTTQVSTNQHPQPKSPISAHAGSIVVPEEAEKVDDVSKHDFLERRIGEPVLSTASNVVNSLNKHIIKTEPRDIKTTSYLEEIFLSTLTSIGTIPNEDLLVKRVLNEKIGIKQFHLREFTVGGSGAKVYGVFIPDGKGKLAYVVKTMKGRTSELARELSSLHKLSDLNLHQSHLPAAQTAGRFDLEKDKTIHTVFVQTAAKGQPLSSIIAEADLELTEKKVRMEKIEAIQSGLMGAAKGLAELHSKNREMSAPVNQEAREFNADALKDVYGWLKNDIASDIASGEGSRIPLSEAELEKIHQEITKNVEGNWGLSGYSHGDSHLDNLFFDSASNQFTFIDTPSFLASVDEQDKPIGFPPYDFAWAMGDISDKGFRAGLSADEVRSLQKSFKDEYERIMGTALAPLPARNFAMLTKQCYFIARANQNQQYLLDNKDKIPDYQMKIQRIQNLIDYEVAALKNLIH